MKAVEKSGWIITWPAEHDDIQCLLLEMPVLINISEGCMWVHIPL